MTVNKQDFSHFESRITGLETDVSYLSQAVQQISKKIDELGTKIGDSSRTNWSTLGTWAAVLLVLVGMWTLPMQNNLGKIERHIESQQIKDEQSLIDRGVLREKLNNSEKIHLDLLKHIDALSERVNNISDIQIANDTSIKFLQDAIQNVKDEQTKRTNKVYGDKE